MGAKGRLLAEDTIDYNRRLQDEDLQRKIVSDRFKQHQAAIAAGMPRSMLPSVDSLHDISKEDWAQTEQRIARHMATAPAVSPSGVGMLTDASGALPTVPGINAPAAVAADPTRAPFADAGATPHKIWQSPQLAANMAGHPEAVIDAARTAKTAQPAHTATPYGSFNGFQDARVTGAGVVATDPETGRRVAVTPNAAQAMSLKTGGAWDTMTTADRTAYLRAHPASTPQGAVVPGSASNGELSPLSKAESRAIELKYAPHVADPMYSGGLPQPVAGHVRMLPRNAPGFINGQQVDGLPEATIPASPARVRAAADAAAAEVAKNKPVVAPMTTGTAATIAQPVTPSSPANSFALGLRKGVLDDVGAVKNFVGGVASGVNASVVHPVTDLIAGLQGKAGSPAPAAAPSLAPVAAGAVNTAKSFAPTGMTAADEAAAVTNVGAATSKAVPPTVAAVRGQLSVPPAVAPANPTPSAIPPPPLPSGGPVASALPTPSAGSATPAQTPLGVVNEQAAGFTKPTAANPLPGTPTSPALDINETPEAQKRKRSMFPAVASRAGKALFGGF